MTSALLCLLLLGPQATRAEEDWGRDILDQTVIAEKIVTQLRSPNLPPETAADLQRQKQDAVKKIEDIGAKTSANPTAQLAVGRSLASVEEAPRAIPYAERGLQLAQAGGDPDLIRQALLTGSQVYFKAGRYDLARERAQQVLKNNPQDKDALALYMQSKDRTSTSASPSGGASSAPSAGAADTARTSRGATTAAVPLTSAAALESQRRLAEARRMLALDAKSALRSFDLAVAAAPKDGAARAERSRARLEAGDAAGALEDAEAAAALDPRSAAALAARAEAKRALGRKEEDVLADYEAAAKLDGRFTEAYRQALVNMGAGSSQENFGSEAVPGGRAPSNAPARLFHDPLAALKTGRFGFLFLLCVLIVVLLAMRRR
ncbi:MAG: hypothetical protein AAB036_09540 [Elusimicrobiota bacterium]